MSNIRTNTINLVTAAALALAFVAPVETAWAGEGGGREDVTSTEINDKKAYERYWKNKRKNPAKAPKQSSLTKTGNTIKAIGTPTRTRAKLIATAGAVVGTAVGEVATTAVTCIARCLGSDVKYRPGDMMKQTFKGLKKMWGFGD